MLREGMRGTDHQQSQMFSYLSPETRVRKDHPPRAIRTIRLKPGETKNREGREVVIASSTLLALLRQCVIDKDEDDHVFTRGDKPVREFRQSGRICAQPPGCQDCCSMTYDGRRRATYALLGCQRRSSCALLDRRLLASSGDMRSSEHGAESNRFSVLFRHFEGLRT